MRKSTYISYPRTWAEAKLILFSLDREWVDTVKKTASRERSRNWISLCQKSVDLYKAATSYEEQSLKEIELAKRKHGVY